MEIIKKKRFWAALLIVLVVLGIATVSALGTNTINPAADTNQQPAAIAAETQNSCGQNCTACITGSGKCTCKENCSQSCKATCGCAKQAESQCGCGK